MPRHDDDHRRPGKQRCHRSATASGLEALDDLGEVDPRFFKAVLRVVCQPSRKTLREHFSLRPPPQLPDRRGCGLHDTTATALSASTLRPSVSVDDGAKLEAAERAVFAT